MGNNVDLHLANIMSTNYHIPSNTTTTEQIMYDLVIGSLNVRGINDNIKRNAIFQWTRSKKFDIFFLQECYCSAEIEESWENEWGGKIKYSHGTKHSKGVMILFSKNLDYTILEEKIDQEGRYIILKLKINEEVFWCFNIYAPTVNKDKHTFFRTLSKVVNELDIPETENVIAGGDWNSIQNSQLDKVGGRETIKSTVVNSMQEFITSVNLIDIWRLQNPDTRRYTFRQRKPLIQTRLDYFYISKELEDYIFKSDIIPSVWSDHSCITLYVKYLPETQRGKGHWKFNSSLLEDEKYIQMMSSKLQEWLLDYENVEDKGLLWELIKYNIRKTTMTYSSIKLLDRKNEEVKLRKKLELLEQNLKDSETLIGEYEYVKSELKQLEAYKVKGSIVRSKTRFIEEGEKSTKYFFGLEKSNYLKKHMRKVKLDNGKIITNQKEVLLLQKEFYERLYSSRNLEKDNIFLNDHSLPKLSDHQKLLCDKELTLEELKESLLTFKNNKSPGTDGITVEFYRKFWDQIGKPMYHSFIYSFKHGELSASQKQAIITLLEKKGKERMFIKNWRPISLLNHDYKILTKALSYRLRKVLPYIIHHNQSAYMEGSYIGVAISIIQDVMEFTDKQNLPGMLLLIDFQKAFDLVEHNFLRETLKAFNFGNNMIRWFNIVTNDSVSCVINNGISSQFFPIKRGVRQGDPLSPYLFILVIEILANYIRKCKDIQGITLKGREIKLSLYADDITAIVNDCKSASKLFEILQKFAMYSGLEINKDKCEGLWLGRWKYNSISPYKIQ